MMADAPAGSEAAAEMRVRMRHEMERVAATLERGLMTGEGGDPVLILTDDADGL
jgi:hypothetical protein